MAAKEIKNKIHDKLVALKTQGVIGEVIVDDLRKGLLDQDIGAYPVAIISPPSVNSEAYTNAENIREYTYEVAILYRGEDIPSEGLEEKAEQIMDAFDSDYTLGGTALGGVSPAVTVGGLEATRDGALACIILSIKARAIIGIA